MTIRRDGERVLNPRMPDEELRSRVFEADRGICAYCGRKMEREHFVIEHVVPWPDGLTLLGNLVTSCRSCNYAKLGRHLVGSTYHQPPAEIVRARLAKRLTSLGFNPNTFRGFGPDGREFPASGSLPAEVRGEA